MSIYSHLKRAVGSFSFELLKYQLTAFSILRPICFIFESVFSLAKEKVTESNFNNINKALVLEFMKCELDSSELIFNNHSCSNSNSPSTNLIGNYITNNLKIKNPYGTSSAVSSNPCTLGTVSISTPSTGNYSINYYASSWKR